MNRWLAFLSIGAILFLTVNSASAALIAYDNFESYTAGGDLNGGSGGTGWGSNTWSGGAGDVTVVSGVMPGYGQSMKITDVGDTAKIISRALETSQTGTVYMGMLFRVGQLDSDDFVQFYANNGGDANSGASTGAKNATGLPLFARVGGNVNNVNSSTNAVANTTFQLVLKIENETGGASTTNYDRANLFIDQATEGTSDASSGANSSVSALSAFNVRTFSFESGDVVYVDELRIATTYAEAIPEPGSFALAVLGLLGLRGRRRRPRR